MKETMLSSGHQNDWEARSMNVAQTTAGERNTTRRDKGDHEKVGQVQKIDDT